MRFDGNAAGGDGGWKAEEAGLLPLLPLLPLVTLATWVVCVIVGGVGLGLGYRQPRALEEPPGPTEVVNVDVDKQAPEPVVKVPIAAKEEEAVPGPAAMPAVAAIAPAPELVKVAPMSAAVAFSVPVEGMPQLVDVKDAGGVGRRGAVAGVPGGTPGGTSGVGGGTGGGGTGTGGAAVPVVEHLRLGEGAGNQPRPEYPREAALGRQEGTVVLRLMVSEDGKVQSVEVISPCPWPLLNQAAARKVREAWRFVPGGKRIYEVPVQFELSK